MRPDGSGRRILIANRGKFRVSEPDFSPDGRSVAFVKSTSRTGSIYVARANGRSARQISPPAKVAGYGCGSFCAASPVFSPDGRLILFVTHGSEEAGLAEVRVKGGGKRAQTIVTRHFDLIRPSWQPLP